MYTREKESVYTLESSILKCSTTRTLKDRLSILYQISMIAADQIDTLLSLFTMRTHTCIASRRFLCALCTRHSNHFLKRQTRKKRYTYTVIDYTLLHFADVSFCAQNACKQIKSPFSVSSNSLFRQIIYHKYKMCSWNQLSC